MKFNATITEMLLLGTLLMNIPFSSLAVNIEEDKSIKNISDIKFKELTKVGDAETWTTGLAEMPTARHSLATVELNGKIYAIGGESSSGITNALEVYDTEKNTWETKQPMPTKRAFLEAVVVENKIYAIGGYDGGNYLNKVEMYDPKTDSWETKQSMPTARGEMGCEVVSGKAYCIGGTNVWGAGSRLSNVEVYDPKQDTWENNKQSMPTSRSSFGSASINNKIYIVGGYGASMAGTIIESYDTVSDTWNHEGYTPVRRDLLEIVIFNNKLYCIGGKDGNSFFNLVQEYDMDSKQWTDKEPMPTNRSSLDGVLSGNKFYCIGGFNGNILSKVEAYNMPTPEDNAVKNAELSKNPIDIEIARDLVNKLQESSIKEQLQSRLNNIYPDMHMEVKNSTANLDVYIKSENVLNVALNTNSISFEDFSGVEDMEKKESILLTINSSLPYEVDVTLPSEIKNMTNDKTMNLDILQIKNNSDSDYKKFTGINQKLKLLDNQPLGNNKEHSVDLMLKGGIAHEKDIYRAVLKFEVNQK